MYNIHIHTYTDSLLGMRANQYQKCPMQELT